MDNQLEPRSDWEKAAACRGANTNLFYPESMNDEDAWAARKICRACPVARECLKDALERKEPFGIRAGLGPHARTALLKGKKPRAHRGRPVKKAGYCDNGHRLTRANTRVYLGKQYCRTCMSDRRQASADSIAVAA